MKNCPRCHKTYDDSWGVCLQCNVPLEDAVSARLAVLEEQARKILAELEAIRKGNFAAPSVSAVQESKISKPHSAALTEDTESRIGKYVLSKIGIISVVAGVGFFLSYVFKYLSPLSKVSIGYAVAAAMMFAGERTGKIEKYKWYGRGITCGAWMLVYFTTYAMYHIQATKVLSNQFVDLVLLSGVVIGMITHLFKYRSQSLVMLVLLMGYVTAGISHSVSFAFGYITVLAVATGYLLVRMNWQAVAGFSLLGAYVTHFLWIRPHELVKSGPVEFWISIGFLAAYWSIFNAVGFFMKAPARTEKYGLSAFLLMNSFFFGLMCFLQVRTFRPEWKPIFALAPAGILSALYLFSGYAKEKKEVRTAFLIAALSFASVSLRFLTGKGNAYILWSLEIPVLFLAGFYLKDILYRIAAAGFSFLVLAGMAMQYGIPDQKSIILGRELPAPLLIYAAGVAAFYLARYVYIVNPWSSKEEENETRLSNLFTPAATFVFIWLCFYEVHARLVTFTWSIGALFLFVVGFLLKDKVFRYSAIGLIAVSLCRVLIRDLEGVNTGYRILVFTGLGVLLLGVSFWYTKMSTALQNRSSRRTGLSLPSAFFILAISVSVLTAAYYFPSEFRKQSELGKKEVALTANFMAGKKLTEEETGFLRGRQFNNLTKTLRSVALEKDGKALDLYLRAADLGVPSGNIYERLGNYYAEQGDKDKAAQWLEKGIALDPQTKNWETRAMFRFLAKIYKTSGDFERAARMYEKYIALDKNVADLYELAVCYDRLGKFDQALEKLNEAVLIDANNPYTAEISSMRSDIYGKKEMLESKTDKQSDKAAIPSSAAKKEG